MEEERTYADKLDLVNFPVTAPEYFNFAYDVIDVWAEKDRNKLAMIWFIIGKGSAFFAEPFSFILSY